MFSSAHFGVRDIDAVNLATKLVLFYRAFLHSIYVFTFLPYAGTLKSVEL